MTRSWTSSTEPEAMGYSNFTKDGKQVAGVGPLQSPEQAPAWTTYVATATTLSEAIVAISS